MKSFLKTVPVLNQSGRLKFACLVFLFSLSIQTGFTQTQKVNDRYLKALEGEITDEKRIETHLILARRYSNSDSVEMMSHINQAREVANRIGNKETKVDGIFVIARYYALRNMSAKVEGQCQLALKLSKEISYRKGEFLAYSRVAASFLDRGQMDTVTVLFNKAIEGQKEIDDKSGLLFSYHNLGNYYFTKGSFETARDYYNKVLDVKVEMGKSRNYPSVFMMIGDTFAKQGLYLQASEYFFRAAEIFEKVNNRRYFALALNNIGNVFNTQNEFKEALKYYEKSLKVNEELDHSGGVAESLNNMGSVYISLGENDKAIEFLNKSLTVREQLDDLMGVSSCLLNLGIAYSKTGLVDKALKVQNRSLLIKRKIEDRPGIATVLHNMAELHLNRNEFAKASAYITEGLAIAEEIVSLEDIKNGYRLLSELENKMGRYKPAYDAHIKHKQFADSLLNQENTKKITRMEAEYEFQLEKDSIAFQQQKANIAYEEEIQRKQVINQAALGGAILVLIILILLYRSYLIKQKKNAELQKKNGVIETKNEELLIKNGEINALRQTEKKMSEETIALKERELTTITMLSHEKNSVLEHLGDQIGNLSSKVDKDVIPDLKEIKRTIKTNLSGESWAMFMYQFEKVHPAFFTELKEQYPILTQHDLRLCAYIKVGMDNKEIAQISNVTNAGIQKSINRLKKKMELDSKQDLRDFLMNF